MPQFSFLVFFLLFTLLNATGARAGQSLVLTPGTGATLRRLVPNGAPYKSVKDLRVDLRLHDYSPPPDWNSWIVGLPDFAFRFVQGEQQLHVADGVDLPVSSMVAIELKGRKKDILARFQRNFATKTLSLEVWDVDGTNYAAVTRQLAEMPVSTWTGKTISIGGGTMRTNIAYVRAYSSVIALNSPPPAHSGGDLADWEFEGNLTDGSPSRLNLETTGKTAYAATPSYAVKARFGEFGSQRTFQAGQGRLKLDGSRSYSSNDDDKLTYAWTQISGPSAGHFENTGAAKTTFTASGPGTYLIRLTVTDTTGKSGFSEVKMGAVATDGNGIVITGNKAMDSAIGPLTMSGTSPWPWYDHAEMANADALRKLHMNPPRFGHITLPGTVTPTVQNGNLITGSGTHFLSDLAECVSKTGNGSSFTCTMAGLKSYGSLAGRGHFWIPDVACSTGSTLNINGIGALPLYWGGNPVTAANCPAHLYRRLYFNSQARRFDLGGEQPLLWFWWDTPDGPATGRLLSSVSSVQDDTHLTLSSLYIAPLGNSRNIHYSTPDPDELGVYWNYVGQPSNTIDYYDNVLALYRVYYRTGIDTYLEQARALADNWWKYGAAHGRAISAPRAIGILGMVARAVDGKPNMWEGIDYYLRYPWPVTQMFDVTAPQPPGTSMDGREIGYMTRFIARAAALYANPSGAPDTAKRKFYCGRLHNGTANWWVSTLDDMGQWEEDLYSGNIGFPAAPFNGRFGSSPYRSAMAALALEESYDVLKDSCGDGTTATLALKAAQRFGDFAHDYSGGKGYGQLPFVQYGSNAAAGLHAYNKSQYTELPNTQGTLSVTKESATVRGAGTNFTKLFPQPAQYIAIPAQKTNAASCNQVIRVAAVESDTQLTLATPWPCAAASGIDGQGYGWMASPKARTDCASLGSPKAQTCEGVPDPSLSHEVHAMWAWLYWKVGDRKYKTWAEQTFGTDYGGPAGGPGTPTAPAGPFATGVVGNFVTALPACTAPDNAPPPCGGYGPEAGLGKSFGFTTGAGNAPNALAYFQLGDRAHSAR